MPELIVNNFITFFVVIDPIGLAALFVSLTHKETRAYRERMAFRGVILSAVILYLFFFIGDALLNALGIEVAAFRVAGGALLFLLAIDMVFARESGMRSTSGEKAEAEARLDISVFPVAFPLIAGPGALTTILLMTGQAGGALMKGVTLFILGVVLLITWAMLAYADSLYRILGETGTNMVSRVLGVLLAALAAQYALDGIKAAL